MSTERAALGAFGERLAAGHLRRAGYAIVATNVPVRPWGEIDIVARQVDTVVLVEVRTRRGDHFGGAAWSITPAKQRRMLRAATVYLTSLGDDTLAARIDVIFVNLDARGRLIGIEHIENAVEG
jgi:putative endonuclease